MKITTAVLVAAGIAPTQARAFADSLAAACALFDINTPERVAAFVSQCSHESAGFTRLEENLFYTKPDHIMAVFPSRVPNLKVAASIARNPKALACKVYGGRLGNGDEASGDGWRYRGRGIMQLTGKTNYMNAAADLGRPYIEQPDLVAQPSDACLTAAWFWHKRNLNALADVSDVPGITKAINGPKMLGLSHRMELYKAAVQALFEVA